MISKNFITYKEETVTFIEFEDKVKQLKVKFNNFEEVDDFILIKEENPIRFYTMLVALWECNKKVVFPNRDSFNGTNFNFVKYIIIQDSVVLNSKYNKILLHENSDTILFSSGSTGKPKGIVHNKNTFIENAKSVINSIAIKNVVSITPLKPYLVSCLSHFLVHKLTHSHLIFIDMDNIQNIKKLSKTYPNLSYVGSPMHLVSMFSNIENKLPDFFLSSGDIFYPTFIRDILDRFPKTVFYNVYGMAELGGRLFINKVDNDVNFSKYKSIGKNIEKTEVKFVEDEVTVKSDLLFHGYIIDGKFIKREEEYFKSGDKILQVGDFYEFFGRKNDEIKVAGNKVSMKYIEQKIASILSDTYTPIVVSEQHDLIGNILILVILSKEKIDISRHEVISMLRQSMDSFEIPHKIYLTQSIPYTQTMKIDRKAIVNTLNSMELLK